LATQSKAAAEGVEGVGVTEGGVDGVVVALADGVGVAEAQATTIFLEHTLGGSTTMIGAVSGLDIAVVLAAGLGVGVFAIFAGFRTKYTIATVAMIVVNTASMIRIVFFIVLLQSR
jgi:hypothetical protein